MVVLWCVLGLMALWSVVVPPLALAVGRAFAAGAADGSVLEGDPAYDLVA